MSMSVNFFYVTPMPPLDRPVRLISGAAPQPYLVTGKLQWHQTVAW